MINSVYAETMENLWKRIKVRIINNEEDFLKYTSSPTHITHKIFNKNEFGGVIVDEFPGLRSKMYSIKKIDNKECNTAKGLSIAIEFNKFKDVLFGKKIVRHK